MLAGAAGSVRAQLMLSEVMADNASTLNFEGTFPDWIELYNGSLSDITLTGWRLTDNATNLNKFVFPSGTVIRSKGYLIVYCDDLTNSPGLHTGFGLAKKGSFVGLYDSGSYLRDSVTYGLQINDFSIGRMTLAVGSPWHLTIPTPGFVNVQKTLGAVTTLRINEWSATNYLPNTDDWLELYNTTTNPVPLGGLVFTSDPLTPTPLNPAFPNYSYIGSNDFLKLDCKGNSANDADELDFKLSHNTGETVTLLQANRTAVIHQITFPGINTVPNYWVPNRSYGWLPDGVTNSANLRRFDPGNATPGKSNFQPVTNLVVNELLSHTDLPLEDAIELFNPTASSVDISGWWVSNDKNNRMKYRFPQNTIVPAYGFKTVYEMVNSTNGFNTNASSTRCFSFNSAHGDKVVITAVSNYNGGMTGFELVESFDPSENGVSFGRYVDSTGTNVDFVPMSWISMGTNVTNMDPPSRLWAFRSGKGATNPSPRVGPLAITEIHYHPPDIVQIVCTNLYPLPPCSTNNIDDSTNEFVEIFNPGLTNVTLYDPTVYYSDPGYSNGAPYASGLTNTWRLRGDVDFDFPTNVSLAPGKYLLVVNFNPTTNLVMLAAFRDKFDVPADVPIFGPYKGKLQNSKGSVELRRPDRPQGPNNPDEIGFVPSLLVEDIQYKDYAPWPTNSDGRGFSLHRVSPTGYGNDPTNWVDSVPSPGRSQTLVLAPPSAQGGSFVLGFMAQAGLSYTVQYNETIGNTNSWVNFQSYDPQPANAWMQVSNGPLGTLPPRFYRVVTPKRP